MTGHNARALADRVCPARDSTRTSKSGNAHDIAASYTGRWMLQRITRLHQHRDDRGADRPIFFLFSTDAATADIRDVASMPQRPKATVTSSLSRWGAKLFIANAKGTSV